MNAPTVVYGNCAPILTRKGNGDVSAPGAGVVLASASDVSADVSTVVSTVVSTAVSDVSTVWPDTSPAPASERSRASTTAASRNAESGRRGGGCGRCPIAAGGGTTRVAREMCRGGNGDAARR